MKYFTCFFLRHWNEEFSRMNFFLEFFYATKTIISMIYVNYVSYPGFGNVEINLFLNVIVGIEIIPDRYLNN